MKTNVNEDRWHNLSLKLDIAPNRKEYERLIGAYCESHRAYHTLQHLSECIEKLDWVKSNCQEASINIAIVEIALWYHDFVYQPQANDNEIKSAKSASEFLTRSNMQQKNCQLVQSLILATCHQEKPERWIHQLMVDIDLSIFSADLPRFEEYERQVRQEYQWVPLVIYNKKRREILEHFLSYPRIYNTDLFAFNYEQKARANLQKSIAKLK